MKNTKRAKIWQGRVSSYLSDIGWVDFGYVDANAYADAKKYRVS